jgi:hypothetical protein
MAVLSEHYRNILIAEGLDEKGYISVRSNKDDICGISFQIFSEREVYSRRVQRKWKQHKTQEHFSLKRMSKYE